MSIPAVILAGGGAKPDIVEALGVPHRALAKVHGKPMIEYVVAALQASPSIGDIFVVADFEPPAGAIQVADHGGFVENVMAGIEAAGGKGKVLLTTADLPFLTADAVEDYLRLALLANVDIAYAVAPVSLCTTNYPGIRRTAVKVREGELTGGNLVLASAEFLLKQRNRIQSSYAARKSPPRLAMMLGPGVIGRLVASLVGFRQALTIPALEKAASRLLGGKAVAIISNYPEVATDLDRVSDFQAVEAMPSVMAVRAPK
jgi:GTP:adenosylcobinamide-phosphate guanylyltransferase